MNQVVEIPTKKNPYIGMLDIEMFRFQCPVFIDRDLMNQTMDTMGLQYSPDTGIACDGMAVESEDENGVPHYCIYLAPGTCESTWVHELSHITDFIMDGLGIPPGYESTEVRAYMMGHLFSQLSEIMDEHFNSLNSEVDPV